MNDLLSSIKVETKVPSQHSRTKSSSSEDIESGQSSDKSANGSFLDDFFKKVAVIKSDTNSISRQLLKLKDIHKQLKFQAQVQELQELRDEMQDDSLKRKLKDVMKEFADLREQFRDDHREEVKRYIFYQKREVADADEVDELIESGQSEQMFQNAILEAGRGHIEDTLLEIAERREAVKEIEKKLLELYQIFIDLSALVEAQGEVLDNIEVQVAKSVDYVASGTAALSKAKEYQNKGRKLMCCSAIILLVMLFAILMGVMKPWESGSA